MNASKALIAFTAGLVLHTTVALAIVFTNNTTIAVGNTTYDGQPIIVSNCTLTINGPHPFTSLLVTSNGVVTHSTAPAGEAANSLNLTIGQDVTVDAGSRIDVSALGYAAQSGPGQGTGAYYGGSGAGYGGEGGGGLGGTNYGSITAPVDFGSGGGNGGYGPGGGIVRLSVGGTLTVLGQIFANGQNIAGGYGAGGSGGSVYLTAGMLAGSGVIRAIGGDGANGGAGGRIALYYTTSTFTGAATAFGGAGGTRGGAGTLYLKAASQPAGTVIVDNGGTVGGSTPISTPIAFNLVITNRAVVYPKSALTLNSLTVATNGLLTHLPVQLPGLEITAAGDVTIEAGGVISSDAKGYGAQSGPGQGTGTFYGGGGAGYGGEGGGDLGGTNYGSITAPVDFGSGGGNGGYGPGGAGGGIVRLSVGGTLTVLGQILANGQNIAGGYGAGGSGGSVYLTAGMLAGSGVIRAIGGDGANGGAGGRIALYYTTSTFTGAATAFGGAGGTRGGAGTIYTKAASLGTGDLLVDNGGTNGAMTWLTSPVAFNVTVTNAGIVRPQAALNLASLLVASNGMVVYPSTQPGFALAVQGNASVENGGAILASCNLTIHGNLLIAGGGAISANGKGFGTDTGPGKGTSDYYHAAGAGYGGLGGNSGVRGGTVYGSLLQPVDLGSGGGSDGVCGAGCPGGAGGGALRLNVDGTLTVNGQLTANGTDGASGGSGGSLFVSAGTLTGSGMVSATGGATGDIYAGGGSGGRIALYYVNSTFAGTVSAVGGLGGASAYSGGPGTIYTKPNSRAFGALLVDGTGRTNAMETPITSPVPFELIVSNATVYPDGALLLGSLLITTNGTITHPVGGPQIQVAVLGDATIQAGAGMAVDGRGYGSATGPGHGISAYYHASGAGYGGRGGASGGDAGGPSYGFDTTPVDLGSGGGGASICGNGCPGGAGGGAIRLTVAGTLLLDGRVTANGRDGASGGSGGSVFLSIGRLAGNGAISVNGGAIGDIYAGGGGAGRIAIYSSTNVFIGTMTASGGTGGNPGGTGTIYLGTNVAPMVIAQYPSDPVNRFVSYVDVTFNQPVDPATFTTNDLVLTAPSGPIPLSQITLTGGGGVTWRIGFPTQSANGAYSFTVGPHIANLFGQEMAASYSGGFTVNFTTPTVTVSRTGGNLSLVWLSATGLSYQLQSATNLPVASWLNEGAPINGTGGLLTNSIPIGAQPAKFFRFWLLEN